MRDSSISDNGVKKILVKVQIPYQCKVIANFVNQDMPETIWKTKIFF